MVYCQELMNQKVENSNFKGERIAKVIARSGVCSRRDAEKLISEGKVKVSGKVISSPALNVTDEKITVNGKLLNAKADSRLFLYHKPVGLVTSHKDEQGRKTVFGSLPKSLPRVVSVGRLDLNSEGLLLLTNDGELARKFEHPKTAMKRKYRVRVFGKVEIKKLFALKKGITIDGVRYSSIFVEVEKLDKNSWLQITLTEGKNREIRKVLKHFGLEVSRLIRVSYGDYELGKLKVGEVKEVPSP